MTKVAKKGDTVSVNYRGFLDNGSDFDSSYGKEPIEFTLGDGQLIPGFEIAVYGMRIGEKKTIHIHPAEAYGDHLPELVKVVDRQYMPAQLDIQVGQQLQIGEGEEMAIVTIAEVTENEVKLDANHPLAGQPLNFEIELVNIA